MKLTFNKVMMLVYYAIAILAIIIGVLTDDEILSTIRMTLGVCLFIAGMLIGREK